jgi:hypothetical protein
MARSIGTRPVYAATCNGIRWWASREMSRAPYWRSACTTSALPLAKNKGALPPGPCDSTSTPTFARKRIISACPEIAAI